MYKIVLRLSIAFLFLSVLPKTTVAQSRKVDKTLEKRQAQLQKQDELKKQKSEEAMEARRQKHIDIQTKAVQKRMKKSKRRSKRINDNRKEFFLSRWFRN